MQKEKEVLTFDYLVSLRASLYCLDSCKYARPGAVYVYLCIPPSGASTCLFKGLVVYSEAFIDDQVVVHVSREREK